MSILEKFDPYAMVEPKTEEDLQLLLTEALAIADDINKILDEVYEACEKDH